MRLLLAGERPRPSAPVCTLSDALRAIGVDTILSDGVEMRSTAAWLDMVRASRAVITINYQGPHEFYIRQLALAAVLGRPVLRWWVGSDVLFCLEDPSTRASAERLDRFCSTNLAVPHLTEELGSVGIRAESWPMIIPPELVARSDLPAGDVPRAVLVYLPHSALEFYGAPLVREAIVLHPELQFIIVADASHSLAHLPNVTSLGWVDDMAPVIERCGALLRITKHDGIPRMVLECLLRARYVLHNRDLPGCWFVSDPPSIDRALKAFGGVDRWNTEGRRAALQYVELNPAIELVEIVERISRHFWHDARRLLAIGAVARQYATRWRPQGTVTMR